MSTATGGVPLLRTPRFKPARDRSVDVSSVTCPTCGAQPRVKCVKVDGQPSAGYVKHEARRRMAIRAENNRQEAS